MVLRMLYTLLVFPLLGGFIFVTFWNRTKVRASKYTGNRLIFYSAIAGLFFLLISIEIMRIPWLGQLISDSIYFVSGEFYTRFNYLDVDVLAFAIGATVWLPLNRIFTKEREYEQAVRSFGNRFENLIFDALSRESLLAITLKNRKTYIGYVFEDGFSFDLERAYIVIWPMLSGCRNSDNLKLNILTNYAQIYTELVSINRNSNKWIKELVEAYDFRIYIRVDEIVSLQGYDEDIRQLFDKIETSEQAKLAIK